MEAVYRPACAHLEVELSVDRSRLSALFALHTNGGPYFVKNFQLSTKSDSHTYTDGDIKFSLVDWKI